jgi:hypothetical protein
MWKQCDRLSHFGWREVETRERKGSIVSALEIQDERAIAREMFVQSTAHAHVTFCLDHGEELQFAPPRVGGITLLNGERTSSEKLRIHP